MLLSDDGQVSLESASPPAEQVARYPNHGNFFSEEMLKTQIQLLKARSLPQVLASVASQKYTGIGAGSGLYSHNLVGDPRLLPASLTDVRTVRLFKKMRDSDQFWIEQEDYQKTTDPRAFCTAMDHAVPYNMSVIVGQCAKPYWGARSAQIAEQYAKYVPQQYVPDVYSVNSGGKSSRLSVAAQALLCAPADSRSIAIASGAQVVGSDESVTAMVVEAVVESAVVEGGSRKYDKRKDDEALIEACPRNSLGKPMSHNKAGVIREIAFKVDSALKWDAVKRAMQRLVKEGRLAPQT